MSRTIGDLTPGTSVWLEYNDVLEEWFVMESNSNRTILLRNIVLPARKFCNTNVPVYDGSLIDEYLEGEYLNGFNDAFKMCLTANSIQTYLFGDTAPTTIARRCYVPSEDNLYGNNVVEDEPMWLDALQAATGQTGNNARKGYNETGTAQYWWLRSPNSAAQFRSVSTNGSAYSNYATNSVYVRPALSVASATIVSDEGADIIRVIPDDDHRYREVSCIGYIGSRDVSPKRARVLVDAVNLEDIHIELSNNAKDTNPVWVDVSETRKCEFTNTQHETESFEIGIKLSGKSETVGWFTEPAVLLEEAE